MNKNLVKNMNLSRKVLKLIILISLFICNCKENIKDKIPRFKSREEGVNKPKGKILINEFIFGYFSGGTGECNALFKLRIDDKKPILAVDYSKRYFYKTLDSLDFKININDSTKIAIAKQILNKLPKTLYLWKSKKETFGCLGCKDFGVIYIEFSEDIVNMAAKKFYIDLMPSNEVSKEITKYADYVNFKINELRIGESPPPSGARMAKE